MLKQGKAVAVYIFQEDLTLEEQKQLLVDLERSVDKYALEQSLEIAQAFYQVAKKQKPRNRWQQISRALDFAKEHQCRVVFAQIKQYHGQSELGEILLKFFTKNKTIHLACLDQKFLSEKNICEIVKHFLQRRRKHGDLIKKGLLKSTSKSGNPKASTVIAQVNRPKILCSVSYALIFDPIIASFEEKKMPQRKIVDQLNIQGLCAPEGGKWVLSQFQKVLERVRLNRLAFALGEKIQNLLKTTSFDVIAHSLSTTSSHLLTKGKSWNLDLVKAVYERYETLCELELLNEHFEQYKDLLEKNNWERLSHSQVCEIIEKETQTKKLLSSQFSQKKA